jgi:hypothetical protein
MAAEGIEIPPPIHAVPTIAQVAAAGEVVHKVKSRRIETAAAVTDQNMVDAMVYEAQVTNACLVACSCSTLVRSRSDRRLSSYKNWNS